MNKNTFLEMQSRLLLEMQEYGFKKSSLKLVRFELNWIVQNYDDFNFKSIVEICIHRSEVATKSFRTMKQRRWVYSVIKEYYETNHLSGHERYNPVFKRGCKYSLNPFYFRIIDYLNSLEIPSTEEQKRFTPQSVSSLSKMFLFLQNNGFENLDDVQEDDIYEYFLDDFGNTKLSRNICVVIKNALIKVGNYCDKCRIISDYIPLPVQRRKNYQFLTKRETNQIRTLLLSDNQKLSYRDKAIAIILFYTGIRAGDLANLRFSNINWNQDLISICQNKTKEPLELPLLPIVGNAIYDYLEKERPNSQDDHIFLMVRYPHRPLRANALWDIAETFNGLMAIPNLIALLLLSGTVIKLTKEHLDNN